MRCTQAVVVSLLCVAFTTATPRDGFSGASALRFTEAIVALGPRTVGSEAHRKAEELIVSHLQSFGCDVRADVWTAATPLGPKRMANIIARPKSRRTDRVVVLSGHYDTKIMPGIHFVGANDGGSSAGVLLEFARVLCPATSGPEVWLVWLDGEESIRPEWTAEDSLYGSRRLAAQWKADGTAARIRALINLDMIGDRDLALVEEWNSTPWLRELVWTTAAEMGYARHFPRGPGAIEDDHIPFLRAGIAALDLIDFDYGPGNSWWHTERDTVDKLSASSFDVVGKVVLRSIEKLGKK